MAIDPFKKHAIVLKIIDERNLIVQVDGEEVKATISARVKRGKQELGVGDFIIVLTNPYELDRVRIHKDTWRSLPRSA